MFFSFVISSPSVVIHNLHIKGIALLPDKTDPPLVIDADAVLARPVTLQSFQSVGGWYAQIIQVPGVVQHAQLTPGKLLDCLRQPPGALPTPDLLCLLTLEAFNH